MPVIDFWLQRDSNPSRFCAKKAQKPQTEVVWVEICLKNIESLFFKNHTTKNFASNIYWKTFNKELIPFQFIVFLMKYEENCKNEKTKSISF